jgi:threonine-phosphate decarboxylase
MLHGHGNNIHAINREIKVDFSSNVWYEDINHSLKEKITQAVDKVVNYPSVDAVDLQHIVAGHYKCDPRRVCITNGATEAFYLIAKAFQNKSSTIFYPSFSEYYDAAIMYNHQIDLCSNELLNHTLTLGSKLAWFANPNNPDGKLLPVCALESIIRNNPDTIFVIDEAYGELCFDFSSCVKLIESYSNLIVVKSVTKLCSIPGLRLGYMIAHEDVMRKVSVFRMPWSVNTLALEAGKYIFLHYNDFILDKELIYQESKAFQLALEKIDGVEIKYSTSNFFLGKLTCATASALKTYLINNYGFLIRDCSNFYGLTDSHFRMSVQGKVSNELCVSAISDFLK